jgi:hypothetical protein
VSRRARLLVAVLAMGVGLACSDDSPVVKKDDSGPGRRVPEPSTSEVRALDHAIHNEGVGPYLLGASLRDVLSRLPYGPRIELLQVDGVADYSLVRAERDRIVIGVQKPAGVTFVTVLDKDIARTEKEVGVGMPVGSVLEQHGPLVRHRSLAFDPRALRVESMPGLRFVERFGVVVAVVVAAPPSLVERPASKCDATKLHNAQGLIRSRAEMGAKAVVSYGCFTGSTAEALATGDDRVAVVGGGDSLRRIASTAVPGLVYAAAIEVDGDDRDEILAVHEMSSPTGRSVVVDVFRVEGSRLTSIARQTVYEVGASSWVGARPPEIEFLVEAHARRGLITVSGLAVRTNVVGIEEVVPLMPVPVVVRERRTAIEEGPGIDAGALDAAGAAPPPPRAPLGTEP